VNPAANSRPVEQTPRTLLSALLSALVSRGFELPGHGPDAEVIILARLSPSAATLQESHRLRVRSSLNSAGAWWEELRQLLELLAARPLYAPHHRLHPLPWALPVPVRVHGHDSRAAVEAAPCFSTRRLRLRRSLTATASSPPTPPGSTAKGSSGTSPARAICCSSPCAYLAAGQRAGGTRAKPLVSPSTRTRDLALGTSLFHWESQSTTTATSATCQRCLQHASRVTRLLGAAAPLRGSLGLGACASSSDRAPGQPLGCEQTSLGLK
jgi:hypothetical protein